MWTQTKSTKQSITFRLGACALHGAMTDILGRCPGSKEVKLSTVTGRKDYTNKATARAEMARGEEA